MARTLFVTPDDINPALVGFVVFLPDDVYLLSAFMAQMYELANAENWQQVGTLSAEDAAQLFADGIAASLPLSECPP